MAVVEYDGSSYFGFQRQMAKPSVQAALERAVQLVTREESAVTGAGRTDAGAHAKGQVVSFLTTTRLGDATLLRALNARLPRDVAVQSLCTVPESFHPRYQAIEREYHYLVLIRATPSPLWQGRAYHVNQALDIAAMRAAAKVLTGTNDFASFASSSASGRTGTVRDLRSLEIRPEEDVIRLVFRGSGFLHHMIRSIVGTLVQVGQGRLRCADVARLLQARDHSTTPAPAPACGLYLMKVSYDRGSTSLN
jgi:tRNA pseudouridine38-40 synthase